MIDWTKPVQTRDGRKVRVLCTDGPRKDFPVIALIDGRQFAEYFMSSGRYMQHGDGQLDLINVPEPQRFTLLVYSGGGKMKHGCHDHYDSVRHHRSFHVTIPDKGEPTIVEAK